MTTMSADDPLAPTTRPVFAVPRAHRLFMVLAGYLPLAHVSLVALAALLPWRLGAHPAWGLLTALVTLYFAPPLAVRLLGRLPEGSHALDSPAFRRWWLAAQCQVLFNRLPALEEALRLIPAAYSAWLRLWGSRIGSLVYWSPGVRVLDRSLVDVGRGAVFGVGARLHPHVILRGDDGIARLVLAPVRIGDGAMIGGFTLLAAGVDVAPGAAVDAARALPPHRRVDAAGRRPQPRAPGAA